MLVDVNRLYRPILHLDVPNLERQVIARNNVVPVVGKLDIRDAMISEKKLLSPGCSSSSYALACLSQSADARMSPNFIAPLLFEYANVEQCVG